MSLFHQEFHVAANDFIHAGEASLEVKKVLRGIGVDPDLLRRVAIASYEGEINLVIHGGGGTMTLDLDENGLTIVCEDHGPGIPDVEKAMEEGFSTASPEAREMGFGAGMGLPNIERNADRLEVDSRVGRGTRLTIRFEHQWSR